MSQESSARVQQTLERIGEDESLTGDLSDPAAMALLNWLTQRVQAADAEPDDTRFRQRVAAIRAAARTAAHAVADDEAASTTVVERAEAALQANVPGMSSAASPAIKVAPPETETVVSSQAAAEQLPVDSSGRSAQPTSQHSLWNSLRRRVRRWVQRKV